MGKSMEVPHKKFIIKLLYNPAIPILGIYLKKVKTLIWKDIHAPIVYNSKDKVTTYVNW